MKVHLGPILGFQASTATEWRVGALYVFEGDKAPKLTVEGGAVAAPVQLWSHGGRTVWRYDITAPRQDADATVTYALAPDAAKPEDRNGGAFVVPAKEAWPRAAYGSCNGFSSPGAMKKVAEKNERWKDLVKKHDKAAYHLMLLGGDQVYGDEVWSLPLLREWCELPRKERIALPFTEEMAAETKAFYFNLYCRRWNQRHVETALASVPTLMMWDDHDIFDGWGSHSNEENACPVFQGVFQHASTAFSVFQRQAAPGQPAAGQLLDAGSFTWGHVFDGYAVLAPDLRTERNNRCIMTEDTWQAIIAWLASLERRPKHLLVMTSIPVVFADLNLIKSALDFVPGTQELEDDLRDHWASATHKAERLRLIHRLFRTAREQGIRVTIVSGDVHVAALGVIESTRHPTSPANANVINQLTSSGMVHPPPASLARWALEKILSGSREPDRGITTRLLELPGASQKLIGARNWLALEPAERERIFANWHIEGLEDPLTKVIHAVEADVDEA